MLLKDRRAAARTLTRPRWTLFRHEVTSLLCAAAAAPVSAPCMYPEAAQKHIVKLCDMFLAVFPAPGSAEEEESQTLTLVPRVMLRTLAV